MKRVEEVRKILKKLANKEKAKFLLGFFKTGPGQYGEGDKLYGITVPESRKVVKQFSDLSFEEINELLQSEWHEERLIALLILVTQFKRGDEAMKKKIYTFYLAHTDRINNWDLVDTSARDIFGGYLFEKDEKPFFKLAKSKLLWDRRIAMVGTFYSICKGRSELALAIAEELLYDKEDLMQKATGWMLREVGKRASEVALRRFLDAHAATMPRTTLRYAIERFSPRDRAMYLAKKQ